MEPSEQSSRILCMLHIRLGVPCAWYSSRLLTFMQFRLHSKQTI